MLFAHKTAVLKIKCLSADTAYHYMSPPPKLSPTMIGIFLLSTRLFSSVRSDNIKSETFLGADLKIEPP